MAKSTPLVLELQALATEGSTDVAELLRKTLLVASKLGLIEFKQWAERELNGYGEAKVPKYRKMNAQLRLKNPFHGLIPCIINNQQVNDLLCCVEIRDPVGSLVDLLNNPASEDGLLIVPLSPQQTDWLMKNQDGDSKLPPVRTLGRNQVAAIIDGIRNSVLQWSLELESDGILGEGLTFSQREKVIAASSSNISIQNFQGVLGNISGSTVTQKLRMNVRQGDFESLRTFLRDSGVSDADLAELQQAVAADPQPSIRNTFGAQVSAWIGKLIGKAASGAWQISVGAAGNLLGDAIGAFYGL